MGRLYVVAIWIGAAMSVTAAPAQTAPTGPGRVLWVSPGRFRGVPVLTRGRVVARTAVGDIVAVDPFSGVVQWRRSLSSAPGFVSAGRLAATSDVVMAGDDGVEGLEAKSGAVIWTTKLPEGAGAGVQLGGLMGDLVFAGSYVSRLFAIEIASGRLRWAADLGFGDDTTVFSPKADSSGVVATFTSFREHTGGVAAFDFSGHRVWQSGLDGSMRPGVIGPVAMAGDVVLAVDRTGVIHALDRQSGRACWTIPDARSRTPAEDFRPLAVAGNTLVAGSLTGEVIAYDLATRAERWRAWPVQASVAFALAVDADAVWVPYVSGHLVELDAQTGRQRWRVGDRGEGFRWLPVVRGADMFLSGATAGLVALHRGEGH